MTKKAQSIYKEFESRINNEFRFTERHFTDEGFDFAWHSRYIHQIYNDFSSMIGNMWLFNLLKESDYHELYDMAFDYYNILDNKLQKLREEENKK